MASKHANELPFYGYFYEAGEWVELGPEDIVEVVELDGDDWPAEARQLVQLDDDEPIEPPLWGDDDRLVERWFAAGDDDDFAFAGAPLLLDSQPQPTPIVRTVRWLRHAVRADRS